MCYIFFKRKWHLKLKYCCIGICKSRNVVNPADNDKIQTNNKKDRNDSSDDDQNDSSKKKEHN